MVQFEEMIKALELREELLRFLEQTWHPFLIQTFGIDMDQIQAQVQKNLPPFTLKTCIITIVVSFIYFQI